MERPSGGNVSFRVDLNARENYLELAERRESVLRLARLLSYNPKRNQCANGLLKIASVSTTEEVKDSNNINLKDQTILWNDSSNTNWYEQFIKVLNLNSEIGTGNVLNTNNCEISICETRIKNKFVIFSAIDNLIKGASGQAVQNMNLLFKFPDHQGLQ